MKKYICLFLALVMAVTVFSACKSTEDTASNKAANSDAGSDDFFTPDASEGDSDVSGDLTDTSIDGSSTPDGNSTTSKTTSKTDSKTTSSKGGGTSQQSSTKPVTIDEVTLPKYDVKNTTVTMLVHTEQSDKLLKEKYGASLKLIIASSDTIVSRFTGMVLAKQPPDIFLGDFNIQYMEKGYVKPWDSLIDFDDKLWQDVSTPNKYFNTATGHYYAIPSVGRQNVIWYNKTLFEQAGKDDPGKLFKNGNWTWDTFKTCINQMTIDSNKDGVPEQYGVAVDVGDSFIYATGTHFVVFDQNLNPVNKLLSPEIDRAMNFTIDISKNYKVYPKTDAREVFAKGKIAMVVGAMWYRGTYKNYLDKGTACFVPTPKDPSADKHYVAEEWPGWYLPKDSKNPEGAAAYLACSRYAQIDPVLMEKGFQEAKEAYGWNRECTDMVELIKQKTVGIPLTWTTFTLGDFYGAFFSETVKDGKSWSTVAGEISPMIDERIARYKKISK